MSRSAPVVALSGVDGPLLGLLRAGGRAVGAREVLECRHGRAPVNRPLDDRLVPGVIGAGPVLLAVADLSGAVLDTGLGYALVAGTPRFLRGALPDGADEARVRFARVARRLTRPGLLAVAGRFPPGAHAWRSPAEVAPGSGVAEQLAVMASLVRGDLPGSEFARRWYAARRRADEHGERVRGTMGWVLGEVFFLLEDYPIDPAQREPGDVTDVELLVRVRGLLELLPRDG
ncbi:hypothetical protein [Amycolatopsis rifamycinica]|uniref:hypothetical protein n=1 Tax=Amycolatopsis rifamycinica TaxID=287986 RepID=UPI00068EE656|nr:hypothetical protein [Amycolatopsis rifamycinica]